MPIAAPIRLLPPPPPPPPLSPLFPPPPPPRAARGAPPAPAPARAERPDPARAPPRLRLDRPERAARRLDDASHPRLCRSLFPDPPADSGPGVDGARRDRSRPDLRPPVARQERRLADQRQSRRRPAP